MLAAAYAITGKLGLLLAISPGYATGIFPPAGLALAAAYLWGWPTLPWIFLGALTLNLWITDNIANMVSVLAAGCIAAASVIQAWVGARVLWRMIGPNARLETSREILGYLALSPLICLMSASLSVGSLCILGVIKPEQIFVLWSIWWIGDVMGVVSFFPIVLALFGIPRAVWEDRRILVVSVMSAILAFVVLGYATISRWESEKAAREFDFQAVRATEQIQEHFKDLEYILGQLSTVLSLSGDEQISRKRFRSLVQPSLKRFPMLQAIEWVPEVLDSRRGRFETSQKQSYSGFVITQRNMAGDLEPAAARPVYYPVTYIEPVIGNEKAIGFDLGSNPIRKDAVLQALQTGDPVASEPVRLVQEQGSQTGLLLLQRIQGGAYAPGVMLAVLRGGDFFERLSIVGEHVNVTLTDTQVGQVIYEMPSVDPFITEFTRTLQFGGRHYELRAAPSPRFLAAHKSLQSWGFLVGGVLGNGLLGALLLLVTGTTNHVRAEVRERTQQLSIQNEVLQAVIDNVPVRVFWKDRTLMYLGCNPAFAKDAGKDSPSEIIGKDDYQMNWAKEAELYRADDMTVMETGLLKINFEEPQTTPSGDIIWLRTSKVPLRNQHHEVIGILGMYDDITKQRAIEVQLRDSEDRFRRLFDSSPDPVWIIDGHHFVECNQAAVDLLGYADKDSLKGTHPSVLSPKYQPDGELSCQKAERLMQVAQKKGTNRFEWVHRRRNGTDFFAEVTLSSITLQGRPVIHCLWRDITERKRADDAIHQSELRLKEAQQLARMGSWELDVPYNQLHWSDETYRIYEVDPAHFGNTYEAFLDAIHPDDRELVNWSYSNSLRNRTPYFIRHRILMMDGRIKYVTEQCRTDFDDALNPIRSFGTVQDVTEQVMAEEALRLSEERFVLAMQAANDGLWDWNLESNVVYFSPRWKSMLGYADHELTNEFSTWERLVDEEGRVKTMELIQNCIAGQFDSFFVEFRMQHQDGHWVDILSRVKLVRDENGTAKRMVGTHVDITERKKTEAQLSLAHKQALAATEAKSNFLASMSHEIRTPLNMINGMGELLVGTALNEEQADYVQRFNHAATHLLELINDILDFSKIEADRLQLEAIPFNPVDVLNTVKQLMRVSADAKELDLIVQVEPGLQGLVIGDPMRLRQVLVNLVGNAIKFTERGHIIIRCEADGPDRVRFEVSDTGIGIPEEKLGLVFENFTQVDATISRKFGGTGLGLAICKRLVGLMQGEITVRSTQGSGSIFGFSVRLPAADSTRIEIYKRAHTEQRAALPDRPVRILLVDDLEDNRDLVALFLKDLPYTIEMAENGAVAVDKFQQGRFDLVLMDMQMPVMDGLQATTAIRDWERTQSCPPTAVVALTAHALKEERDKSLAAGCTAHLTKPIKKQELLRAIADYTRPLSDQAA